MKLRVLTAVPLALAVAALLWWAPFWPFLLVLLATIEIGLFEFFAICRHAGFRPMPIVGYGVALVVCFTQVSELSAPQREVLPVLVLAALLISALALWHAADLRGYLGTVATTVFGVLYVALTLSFLIPMRFSRKPPWAEGRELVFLLFLVIWAGDICAYLVGRSVGRTPLFSRVSPKKTVEGAIGGFSGSLLVAWGFTHWFWRTADLKAVILWAGLVALAGQVGDLVESALKRGAGLKDSGTLLPGHGGLLDRIDSLLFGAPALWLALTLSELWK